ncbi:MAG: trigger factor [Xanthomonadales bacterium]|nr:trigger factor [Xanthomonadales bacterium]NIN60747.1 trigger factor [Xanthomonadales bacterium]NIN76109.1 trigger factor [Xanthomonadales bacterium]NIO15330.1 trigger factor [Xanthomonadales bacterium]NIP13140.1 trigger factor [Xanthomonadales bacterium]
MQISVEKAGNLQRRVTVQVPGEELHAQIEARLRELGKKAKVKGFRPGRVPPKVLRQMYGKSVQQEVVAQTVQASLAQAIEREALRPASNPVLDGEPSLPKGGDLEFTARIEVYPEVDTIDAAALHMKRPQAEVTDVDIDDMLETLRLQRQTWRPVEGKPQPGQQVTIEYTAQTDAGPVPEQGRQRLALVIGESGFDALEQAVSDLQAGEETEVELTFPADYGESGLAGATARVQLTLTGVLESHLPEIDTEFIRSFAVESGAIEDLRDEVRNNLERELKQASTSFMKAQLVERLLELHADLEVPEGMVRDEARNLARHFASSRGQDPQQADPGPFVDGALRRVKAGLLLAELARQNHIMIDGARVRESIETIADTYEQPREVVQMYYGDQRLLGAVENAVLEEQVVDWVLERAKVEHEPMSFKDVISAASAAGKGQ